MNGIDTRQIAAIFRKNRPHITSSPVFVIGQYFNQHRHAAGSIAFVN